MSREAMQMALEALENIGDEWGFTSKRTLPKRFEAITALRQALKTEQESICAHGVKKTKCIFCHPEQEPVAHIDHRIHGWPDCFVIRADPPHTSPLYLSPPKREWVGLTLNEAEEFYEKYTDRAELINAVDKFLEEKNHG